MDAVVAVLAIGLLVGLSFIAGLPFWGYFWITMMAVIAAWELIAKLKTGRTLSQQMGDLLRRKRWLGIVVLAVYGLACAGLIVHLWAMGT